VKDRKFSDGRLPLSRHEVSEFLGEENVNKSNFLKDQYMFSPIVLEKGMMIDSTPGRPLRHIPYLEEQYLKAGSHGRVYRVMLAGNHFGPASDRRTICARKDYDINNSDIFEAEWHYVEKLRASQKRPVNILETFAGVRTPNSLSLFCELANCDLDDFMNSVEGPKGISKINSRLVQFSGVVRGVEFLHRDVKSRNGVRDSCFHLDLKPKNILVLNIGKGDEIFKISDFSISRYKNQIQYLGKLRDLSLRDMSTTALLGDGATCLAPEAFGSGRVSASNDVWHLGCVLCMFIAWLHRGPKGLQDFHESRYSKEQMADWFFSSAEQQEPPSDTETEYYREAPNGTYSFFRLSFEVENWLDQLLKLTKGSPEADIYSDLVKLLKSDLLIAEPRKRAKVENVRERLASVGQNRKGIPPKIPVPGPSNISSRPGRKK
jgi:serine/threonine protein kinase